MRIPIRFPQCNYVDTVFLNIVEVEAKTESVVVL